MSDSEKWAPGYIFTVYDPTTYLRDTMPVETVYADRFDREGNILFFRDDKGILVSIHHLAPGHSMMITNRDGYSLQETLTD